ncbi:hypothetical protein BD309DRAFT_180825 [Dichomitus squalens]|uniref:Uncharacterized protein n=1 Tax=Dichomitus squalens TaxID=114155 RepID=A0A4Q9MBQ7_9APHY|nr:hypothetical protein BD311DRAFT_105554 [Dichomitus squalens]TBU42441.1 hypothetical protein BD309DRAFT_180825 [Dichomitus squalens]
MMQSGKNGTCQNPELSPNSRISRLLDHLYRAMWMYALTTCLHVPFFALGTSFMFHVNLVPEFTDACRVMYGWITDILYRAYTPNSIHCISSLALRTSAIACAALLGYMLDKLRWGAHSTSPFINIPLDRFHGQSYGRHFQQFHRFLHAAGESAYAQMPGALLYIRFLLEHRDHLLGRQDLLTHIMEGLSTAFILADGRRSNPTVHNVVLSRRWLINLTSLWNVSSRPHPHVDTYPKMFFNLFSAILGGLCKLPTAANRSPTSLSQNIVANVSRAIKSFFLVGQWLQLAQDDDRSRIVGQIGRTSKHFRPHHIQTLFTTGTPDWEDLARAVWQYNVQDRGSAEELVHVQRLEDLPEDRAMETYETIVCVTYTSLTDLPSLLSIQQTHAQPTPFLPQWFLPRARPTAEGPKQVLGLCLRGQQGPLPVL